MNFPLANPVFHVYYPTTFVQVLSEYLSENGVAECAVLGQWELLRDKMKTDKDSGSGTVKVSNDSPSKGTSPRRTRSRNVISAGNLKLASDNLLPSGSVLDPKPGSDGDSPNSQQLVCAISIVGIAPSTSEETLTSEGVNQIGVIGRASGTGEFKMKVSNFQLYISVNNEVTTYPPQICVEAVTWNKHHYRVNPSFIIMFEYDPHHFQQWDVPQAYKIGVPKVLFESLSEIQNGSVEDLPFTSTFPPETKIYHDLLECSKPPSDLMNVISGNPVINFLYEGSTGLQQIFHKVSILITACKGTYSGFAIANFLILLLIDSLLGYVLSSYLLQIPDLVGILHISVEELLARLNHLLKWLRGAPAGLKLNINLNSLLWRFFSYHIHLWTSYIGILEPVFAILLMIVQQYGIFGATIQVAFFKDLLYFATFHIYCLYIYSTRLYSLQTAAIKALFRLFFGRKYNPLRERMDNVQLTTSELFLSSFIFVILIFLFPTVFVYYVGFLFLRVPVLLIMRTLITLITAFNNLPLVAWLLVFFQAPQVADEVYFEHKINPYNGVMTCRIRFQSTRTLYQLPNIGSGINTLIGSVMEGKVLKE